jgi:hypothetical protein
MAEAVCMRCGNHKSIAWATCERCGYDPNRDAEGLVRSVYLSVGRFDTPHEKAWYRTELDRIGLDIEKGEQPGFAEAELDRLRAQGALVRKIGAPAVSRAMLRIFLPAIGLLVALFAIAYLVRVLS